MKVFAIRSPRTHFISCSFVGSVVGSLYGKLLACGFAVVVGAGCDGADGLDRLRADLTITPDAASTTAWVGIERVLPFTLKNTGAAPLHLRARELRVEGAPAALAVQVRASAPLDVLEGGQAVTLELFLRADASVAETAHSLTLVAPAAEQGVADARAALEVRVRTPPPCAPADPCEVAGFDDDTGECVRHALPDATPCDDASACTDTDRCSSGTCIGTVVTCDDEVDCTVDACEPARGCVFEPVRERCTDGNSCTQDICHPERGCENPTSPDGTPCGPFSCAQFEVCSFGACTAWPTPEGFPCEDGDLCTVGDTCQAQECASGGPTLPSAQPPVALARPTAHVPYELRWMLDEQPARPSTVPEAIDVELSFGAVLDIEQGLVGFTPRLAVLWKSEPFDVNGAPCSPWQPLGSVPSPTLAQFCATAVVVTYVDESALRSAERGAVVGESEVLAVAYGTVDAAFVYRSLDEIHANLQTDLPSAVEPGDTRLALSIVESTYFPGPLDPARFLRVRNMTLSLEERTATLDTDEWINNAPRGGLEANVHGGVRIAAARAGESVALLGWDLPQPTPQPGGGDSAERPDGGDDGEGGGGTGAAIDEQPWLPAEQTLDRIEQWPSPLAIGVSPQWEVMRSDVCPNGQSWLEDQAFREVDLVRADGASYAIALHGDLTTSADGCGELGPLRQLMVADLATGTSESDGIGGVIAAGLSPSADLLAHLGVNENDYGAPLRLSVDTSPFNHSDPVVTLHQASVGIAGAVTGRVAALEARTGSVGAVVAARDAFGYAVLELVEELDTDATTHLWSESFVSVDAPLVARRSPLSPQSVYAVSPGWINGELADGELPLPPEGVLVRFGCPFPSAP